MLQGCPSLFLPDRNKMSEDLNTPPEIESPRAKCLRLEAEMAAKEEMISKLNDVIDQQRRQLQCQELAHELDKTYDMAKKYKETELSDVLKTMSISIGKTHN